MPLIISVCSLVNQHYKCTVWWLTWLKTEIFQDDQCRDYKVTNGQFMIFWVYYKHFPLLCCSPTCRDSFLRSPDGVPAEPFHLPGGYVHRQLGAIWERRTNSLQPRVWLPEHNPHPAYHPGKCGFEPKSRQIFLHLFISNTFFFFFLILVPFFENMSYMTMQSRVQEYSLLGALADENASKIVIIDS